MTINFQITNAKCATNTLVIVTFYEKTGAAVEASKSTTDHPPRFGLDGIGEGPYAIRHLLN
jgi:hypothetical protein